jgi:O-antigen/teichoic acid export membrane protein
LPLLLPQSVDPMKQLGIYGANYKMAVLLNMFIQAFRFAFEPFFFSQKADQESKDTYVVVMKYFVIIGLIMFLGLSTFVDVLKQLISPGYRDGIGIIPIVLMANFFMGVYFTQSLWYKVTDKTKYGAYLGFIGAIITVIINVMLIPIIGYYASALALLACFVFITVASYLLGRKYFPIAYDLKSFFFYLILSVLLFGIYWTVRSKDNPQYWLAVLVNLVFFVVIFFREKGELNKIIKS